MGNLFRAVIAIHLLMLAAAGKAGEVETPTFELYPLMPDPGQLVLSRDISAEAGPLANRVAKALQDGEQQVFARKYWAITLSCGTACEELVLVDGLDGRVFTPLERAFSHGIAFVDDSPLLIVNPPENIEQAGMAEDQPDWLCTHYYLWLDEQLLEIDPVAQCGQDY
ncbi:MAG: hypothetical protein CVV16_03280 [Gammaproteobacteria bacterium HGW-Gammaproteobacteria-6]|nr:MAG: hypothetical protein CVV16_03280 [Gammaproteobacteria bacterium HGW-Gammaproteobacteria-6]